MGYDLNSDGNGNKYLTAAFCGQGADKPRSDKASDVRAAAPAPSSPPAPARPRHRQLRAYQSLLGGL